MILALYLRSSPRANRMKAVDGLSRKVLMQSSCVCFQGPSQIGETLGEGALLELGFAPCLPGGGGG